MEAKKVRPKGWLGVFLLSIFLLSTLFWGRAISSSKPKDTVGTAEGNPELITYSTGFGNNPGTSETINGVKYKNYSYFEVEPDQYMEYIYRSGDVIQFFGEGPSELNIWIVNEQRDSIGSAMESTVGLTEYLGNSYYKIRILNKNAKKFGIGIKQ